MSGYDDWIGLAIPDSVMEDAAAWMALLDSDDCTQAQRIAFAQWLSEDPIRQSAFEELSAVWAKLHMLTDVKPLAEHPNIIPFPDTATAPLFEDEARTTSSGWSTLAASVLIVVSVMVHGIFGIAPDRHNTGSGEQQTIAMADGSVVELGAESTIVVRIDDASREVRLLNGRALFDIRDEARPFVVVTDLATMTAVGTRFSARTDAWGVEISVIEGTVSVTSTRDEFLLNDYERAVQAPPADEVVVLGAGQRLVLSTGSRGFLVQAAL